MFLALPICINFCELPKIDFQIKCFGGLLNIYSLFILFDRITNVKEWSSCSALSVFCKFAPKSAQTLLLNLVNFLIKSLS